MGQVHYLLLDGTVDWSHVDYVYSAILSLIGHEFESY